MIDNIKKTTNLYVHKWGAVFFINLAVCIFAYSLLLIHQLVNQLDGLWHGSESVANGWELSIGRWLWRYLDKARFHISADPVTSIFALVLFILSTIIMLEVLDVEGRIKQVSISLLFLISASICCHLSFRYMSLTFGFGMFFAAFAVLLMIKVHRPVISVITAALFIALSTGCYQAFIGIICLIILVYIALCIKKDHMTGKELGMFTLRSLLTGISGGILYFVILNLELFRYNTKMNDYNGASDLSITGILSNVPTRILTAYHDWFEYFGNGYFRINIVSANRYIYCVFVVLLLVLAFSDIKGIFARSKGMAVVYAACILFIPVASNISLLIAYNSFMSMQMTVPEAMSVPALMCLALNRRDMKVMFYRIAMGLVAVIMAVLIYTQFYMVQYDQQSMYMGRLSSVSMAEQIEAYLVNHDLLHPYYKYVIVGKPSNNKEFYINDFFGTANDYAQFGNFTDDPGGSRMSWQGLWWFERGLRLDFSSEEKWAEMFADETVRNMPVFPDEGSCVLYNDVVVVKVSEPPALD